MKFDPFKKLLCFTKNDISNVQVVLEFETDTLERWYALVLLSEPTDEVQISP